MKEFMRDFRAHLLWRLDGLYISIITAYCIMGAAIVLWDARAA